MVTTTVFNPTRDVYMMNEMDWFAAYVPDAVGNVHEGWYSTINNVDYYLVQTANGWCVYTDNRTVFIGMFNHIYEFVDFVNELNIR